MTEQNKQIAKAATLTVFGLAMMNVAAVMSLRGLPMMAAEGMTMFFYILFASFLFLVPVSLIAAELASAFPTGTGGVYRWVREAYTGKMGFVAVFLQWIQNVIWYPTVLAFCAGSLAYVAILFFDMSKVISLSSNSWFIFAVIVIVYWLCTLNALRGMKASGKLTTIGVMAGTIIPGILIIGLGLIYFFSGKNLQFLNANSGAQLNLLPNFSNFANVAFLAGIVLLFAGMEVGAVHVNELKDPTKQFPKSVFVALFIIIAIFTLGSLAVAAVIPASELNLNAGLMQAFQQMFTQFFPQGSIMPLLAIMGVLTAFGVVGGVAAWICGPSKGLLATAVDGELPPFMAKTNKNGVQVVILTIQGIIVTILASLFLIMDNPNAAFMLLSSMTAILYLIMYIMMYASAIKLRYTMPNLPRPYKVPGGNAGMWIFAGVGILAAIFAMIVGFFPPSNLEISSPALYVLLIVAGVIIFSIAPFIIHAFKKPTWLKKENDEQNPQNTPS